jgi:predicted transcriptional regulator of viral defense system
MRHTILSPFENLPYFTIQGFRQIAGEDVAGDDHARVALYRWVKAGYLIALKKGIYMHHRFYERHRQEATFSPVVSAILLPQSYLSLEFILQQHGILTEITYPVTAITIKNTHTITNSQGTFVYRHIQSDLYAGFQMAKAYGIPYAQASVAKALFDYLYLRPHSGDMASSADNLAEELRLNLEEFTSAERDEFACYVTSSDKTKMGGMKMRRILKNLENHVWQT